MCSTGNNMIFLIFFNRLRLYFDESSKSATGVENFRNHGYKTKLYLCLPDRGPALGVPLRLGFVFGGFFEICNQVSARISHGVSLRGAGKGYRCKAPADSGAQAYLTVRRAPGSSATRKICGFPVPRQEDGEKSGLARANVPALWLRLERRIGF